MTAAPATEPTALNALLARAKEAQTGRGLPPVERWEPPFCGDLDMEIRANGTWFYMGTPIGREALVKLFASVLRKDADGDTYLVTPVEKCRIRVVDAHFLGVELDARGAGPEQILTLRCHLGDVVEIGPDHPLRCVTDAATGAVKPYVRVRGRLEALMTRAVTHQLMDLGTIHAVDGRDWFGLWSHGVFAPVAPAETVQA